MKKNKWTKNSGIDKKKELNSLIEAQIMQLAEETDEVRISEGFKNHIEMMARFHNYSVNNQILIMLQKPDATLVAGYQTWKNKFGRHVIKGEKGIRIFAKGSKKYTKTDENGKEEEREYLTFHVVNIFDVSQTEGEPIEMLNWRDTVKDASLNDALIQFANNQGIEVELVKDIAGGADGTSSGGKIRVSESSGSTALIHEIAHELIHWADKENRMSRKQEEIEAETVAYTVGQYFNIEADITPNYLALWKADGEEIRACLGRIRDTIKTIIEEVEVILQPSVIEEDTLVMAV